MNKYKENPLFLHCIHSDLVITLSVILQIKVTQQNVRCYKDTLMDDNIYLFGERRRFVQYD